MIYLDEVRKGTSENTPATPADFPSLYDYGTGTIYGWSEELMVRRMPEPASVSETVLHADIHPTEFQTFYLWEQGNMPTVTKYTKEMQEQKYYDGPDFRPFLTAIPLPHGVKPQGAVVMLSGGGFNFRSDYFEALPTTAELRAAGILPFILDYRIVPYTREEGAADVARAVRFVRKNAAVYGIEPAKIAVMGYSAGAIQNGYFLMDLHRDPQINGTSVDASYKPDALDAVDASVTANGIIYSFFGDLNQADLVASHFENVSLPPAFFVYGTADPLCPQFEAQYELFKKLGFAEGRIALKDWKHGFGGDGGWAADYSKWLLNVFSRIQK